ncbi:DUF1488 domain-containing protein [Apirhabdus apintestini]|uniref:DUF1488 domain-containing protein n=1 Tax=Erwinia sp. HR93 TaxID=3094840 RepID=UPI002ADEB278|nr:DUF1488 domain-containing protein [Erwinia sp. HR93]MEA1063191.1 DUF1488 domain-containing protein [Erwinia sp. HR93]WPM84611.1 DUF1488 domain-containing protein [Enterobacteriaceae bacterium CA-0114]
MNQSIHFPDRQTWDINTSSVCFPVLVNGVQLVCAIKGQNLLLRFGGTDPVAVFCANRWDLEEEASDLILSCQEDEQGWIWLS